MKHTTEFKRVTDLCSIQLKIRSILLRRSHIRLYFRDILLLVTMLPEVYIWTDGTLLSIIHREKLTYNFIRLWAQRNRSALTYLDKYLRIFRHYFWSCHSARRVLHSETSDPSSISRRCLRNLVPSTLHLLVSIRAVSILSVNVHSVFCQILYCPLPVILERFKNCNVSNCAARNSSKQILSCNSSTLKTRRERLSPKPLALQLSRGKSNASPRPSFLE